MTETNSISSDEVIDLRKLFRALWQAKWFLLAALIAGAVFGYWRLSKYVPVYRAEIIVLPQASENVSAAAQGLSNVVGALGFSSPATQVPETYERLTLNFGSIRVAEDLNRKYNFVRKIYYLQWNGKNKSWRRPTGFRFEMQEKIFRKLRLNTWKEPDTESLARYFSTAIVIENVIDTSFRRIYFEHADAQSAYDILDKVYSMADAKVREDDIKRNAAQRKYVTKKIRDETLTQNRSVLLSLLSQIEQKSMLLSGDDAYAARIVEPLRVEGRAREPQLALYLAVPTVLCVAFMIFLISIIAVFRGESEKPG